MIQIFRFRPHRAILLALALAIASALSPPLRAQTPPLAGKTAKPVVVSVAQYRAQRVKARDALAALAARTGGGARNATKILRSLDKAQIVRRADGQTQSANGTRWNALAAGVAPPGIGETFDVKSLQRAEIRRLEQDLETEIAELDAWNTRTGGAYYTPVDAGAIIKELEKSGQIRTGPTWLQAQTQAIKQWFLNAWRSLQNWIQGLFPRSSSGGSLPNLSWLVVVFWIIIAALLGFLLLAAYRAFAGNIRWGGRRKKRGDEAQLEGEDAELLLLPPDELNQRAAQFADEGNFREALRHRYIALLLRLDNRGVWRYDTRRTNWEHIAALRRGSVEMTNSNAEIVAPLSNLTRRFDRVRYGGAPCDGNDWQQFERDAQNLEARASATPARAMAGAPR